MKEDEKEFEEIVNDDDKPMMKRNKISYIDLVELKSDDEIEENIEMNEDEMSLREAISGQNSKFLEYIEKYVTHKFYFNLLFVFKVALGIKNINYFLKI